MWGKTLAPDLVFLGRSRASVQNTKGNKMLYGIQGRTISAIAAIAGVLSAIVAAAQVSNIFTLVPQKYTWIVVAIPIVSLFVTTFSERLQGGASKPEVRAAAESADRKEAATSRAGNGNRFQSVALPLLLIWALMFPSCNTTAIRAFRAALEASPALTNSLVAAHIITQAQADMVTRDFKDGADVALQLDADFKAIPSNAPDKRARKLTASVKAERAWRAIIARHNFAINSRVQQAADIADGILSSLVVFYSESGPLVASANARATVTNARDEKELEKRLSEEVDRLKQALKP